MRAPEVTILSFIRIQVTHFPCRYTAIRRSRSSRIVDFFIIICFQRRPAITRIPVERRPSEDEEEEGPYKNADPRPVRVTIDYDPRSVFFNNCFAFVNQDASFSIQRIEI